MNLAQILGALVMLLFAACLLGYVYLWMISPTIGLLVTLVIAIVILIIIYCRLRRLHKDEEE